MRQTSKRARRSRGLMILIFMLLTALVLWGLAALLSRLFHYGANATVSAKIMNSLRRSNPAWWTRRRRFRKIHMIRPAFIWTADFCTMKAIL